MNLDSAISPSATRPPNSPYSRPPIVEALLDIQVDLPGDFPAKDLLKCQQRIEKDYPVRKEHELHGVRVSVTPDESSSSISKRAAGYVFTTPDGKQLFQAKTS